MPQDVLLTIILSVFASTGFWAFAQTVYQTKTKKKSVESRLLMGLTYSKIIALGEKYIDRGYISTEEYTELRKYLYEPYAEMGGNGTCKKIMEEVDRLPLKG